MAKTSARQRRKVEFNPALLLGLPYIVAMLVFGIVPMLLAAVFSISKFGAFRPVYFGAGLTNYIDIIKDPQLPISFGNILKFAAVSLPVNFVVALGLALVLNLAHDRLGTAMRTIYFIPGAITLSAVALIAVFMVDPGTSPIGFLLRMGGATRPNQVLNSRSIVIFFVIVRLFSSAGGWIAIFYGALSGINREIIEAGMIDGCGPWQLAYYIKRPMIMGYVWFMLITLTISSLQLFAEPFVISTGLAGNSPIDQYWSPNMWAQYLTVRNGDFGRSAVISLTMLLISLVAAFVIITRTGFFQTDVQRE